MSKWFLSIMFIIFLIGCSPENTNNEMDNNVSESLVVNYKLTIEKQQEMISDLEEELQQVKEDYELVQERLVNFSAELQVYDNKSRRIMRLIKDRNFEDLKRENHIDFEVEDGKLHISDSNSIPIPIKFAESPMFIAFFNLQPDFTEIAYYVDIKEDDERYRFWLKFDKDGALEDIATGDT